MTTRFRRVFGLTILFLLTIFRGAAFSAQRADTLDQKVKSFLERHQGQWNDMNISANDGKYLYDLIIQNKYIRALEIGTSTGHSGI